MMMIKICEKLGRPEDRATGVEVALLDGLCVPGEGDAVPCAWGDEEQLASTMTRSILVAMLIRVSMELSFHFTGAWNRFFERNHLRTLAGDDWKMIGRARPVFTLRSFE